MNARFTELIAGDEGPESWAQAGDQLYLDLDLSVDNLPTGTWLELGEAILEIQPQPHTGCVLFSGRFGSDALRMTASEEGQALRLRGANTVVVRSGSVRTGDPVRKVAAPMGDSGSSSMGVARAG
jgi:MOSC domain-containing protein YiiM